MNSWALAKFKSLPQQGPGHCYSIYGLRVRTAIPLSVPELPEESSSDVDILAGDPGFFQTALHDIELKSDWAQAHRLPERWVYARVEGSFDFLIDPDGSQIFYRLLGKSSVASLETYLLGPLMKAVFIKRNIYSLHGILEYR